MDILGLYRLENETDSKKLPELSVLIVTVITYAISVLLLSTHLIVFSITKTMWTTMGKTLASFCLSMVLGFCTFISAIVVKNDHKFYIIGIVLAFYCSLSHSSWLLSMSFENWRTFKKTKSQRRYESKYTNRFVWYSLFSWLEPAIFLGLALYAEFSDTPLPSYLKPNFVTKNAYFRPVSAFTIFFVLPLGVNLILNIVFLIIAGHLMRRSPSDSYSSAEDAEVIWQFKLYSRLNIFTTLIWLANLLDAFVTKNIVCNIFIIIFSVIQALYIFLVFTFNNKISTLMHYEDKDFSLQILLKKTNRGNEIKYSPETDV